MSKLNSSDLTHDCPADTVELLRELRVLQSTGILCDVKLTGSDASSVGIPCHRCVLTAHSPYFRAVFTHDGKESSEPVFRLGNIDQRTLKELVGYAYTMDLNLSDDNVTSVLIAAQFLGMTPVAARCWKYLEEHLCVSTCLTVHALASHHHNPHLAAAALDLICRHCLSLTQGLDFLQMDAQQVAELLASDDLEVSSEDQVWEAVQRWLDHDRPERLPHVSAVLQAVRAPFLSAEARQEYAALLAVAPVGIPSGQSAEDGQLADGTAQNTIPRHSCGAQDVIVCVGGYSDIPHNVEDLVHVINPSIPAAWSMKALPAAVDGCVAEMLDDRWMVIATAEHIRTVQRDSHFTGLRTEGGQVAALPTPRHPNTAGVAVLNGRLYVIGGTHRDDEDDLLACVEAYDFLSRSWSAVSALPHSTGYWVAVACAGRLYAFGNDGSSLALAYDPAGDTWTRLADMPTPRAGVAACVTPSGLIYIVGGAVGVAPGNVEELVACALVESYDPTTNQWQRKVRVWVGMNRRVSGVLFLSQETLKKRGRPGCACVGGKLYVLGGYDYNESAMVVGVEEDSIEVYDEEADSWALHECRLPLAKHGFGCAVMKLKPG
ncbi:kelch-like protein 5 [Paramacrobiotus metropolitanus]|uniref:kelch-like protein 5 n=1 Tax=Paramacrobiotus metropolitanus TaxID=2943436 RepID=UPI0024462F22|nr:kelch-like protein 5 [Paramacrobiotus metropolitanus]